MRPRIPRHATRARLGDSGDHVATHFRHAKRRAPIFARRRATRTQQRSKRARALNRWPQAVRRGRAAGGDHKWRDRDTVDLHSQRDMARPVRGGQPEENGGDGKRERVRRLPTLRLVNGGKLRGGVPGRRLKASRDGQPVPDGQSASGDAACAAGVPGRLEAPDAARRASTRLEPSRPSIHTVPRRHHRPRTPLSVPGRLAVPGRCKASRDDLVDQGRWSWRLGTPSPSRDAANRPRTRGPS